MANSTSDAGRNHFITPVNAKEMIDRFDGMREKILLPDYKGKDILPISETFENTAMRALLDQPGCVKFRTYLGMNDKLEVRIIFVGVNDKDQDIMAATADSAVILEEGTRCPPFCPPPPPPPPAP